MVNPLRLLHRVLRPVLPRRRGADRLPDPGLWPATVGLLAFPWLELVRPYRHRTRTGDPRRIRLQPGPRPADGENALTGAIGVRYPARAEGPLQ